MTTSIIRLLALPLAAAALTSCIREEAPNAECDITGLDPAWLAEHQTLIIGNPIVTNNDVLVTIQKGADRTALAPTFTLTPGASLTAMVDGLEVPANGGLVRDFSTPQTYTARAEDGVQRKNYEVSFTYPTRIEDMSFEHMELDKSGRYQTWYEVDAEDLSNPKRGYWATGNAGFAFTGMGKTPEDYPTATEPVGVVGNAVRLVTRRTGSFGDMVKMPIAAGNIFIGTFDSSRAMSKPRQATAFGLQLVYGEPLYLEGYYKYTAGPVFTDKDKRERPELHDTADIYAVVYEARCVMPGAGAGGRDSIAAFKPLDGDSVLTSPRIVMMARIDNPGEPQEWTHFREPFRLMPGRTFDELTSRRSGYAIAVVATSSRQGAYFEGAVGSTLLVDELRVVWKDSSETLFTAPRATR